MPPSLGDRLFHILQAIDEIEQILSGRTRESLKADLIRRLALERELEIICEASRHVTPELQASESQIDWKGMLNLGNILRHAYHRADIGRLLIIAEKDLPLLKSFVQRVLAEERKR